MRYIHRFFVTIFVFFAFILFFGVQNAFASSNYLNQINKTSSSQDVKKLQNIFRELDLYSGEIDGEFESIKDDLIDYQIDEKIIPNAEHDHAGYFGKRTIKSLLGKYGSRFTKLQDKYLKYSKTKGVITSVKTSDGKHYKGEKVVFEATAYYSAIPGQREYYMGTYEAEIRLQGQGTATASGTVPHPGTLALPRSYNFGTKIYLEGLGVGVVEDRGGAIKGNKIDIWMGTGDAGRERALKFGRRKIVGYIVDNKEDTTIHFADDPLAKYTGLKVDAEKPETKNVKDLQKLLKQVGLYEGSINGRYSTVQDILVDFQVQHKIIKSKDDEHAGYFGNKTFQTIRKVYGEELQVLDTSKNVEENQLDIEEDYNLDASTQALVENISLKIKRLIRKQVNTDSEYDEQLQKIKSHIENDILPALREEKIKNTMKYLVEIL